MEILSSRILVRPTDPATSLTFYRDTLGLAIHREFPGGTVFYLGAGLLELSGRGTAGDRANLALWLQVRDLETTQRDLRERGVTIVREAREEPWGLREMWIADPDGVRIVLVEIPENHPMRKDQR
ncbi:VOC family protein [Actinophytocola sp.]|jgi:catechol 2,3-dioxygenase-like lactoylglutathione lyase family enzyme|uniref:VOC family protein n=1 Tax=Actinophytocola sp. TaxID=1872138 RepID=UPI002ED802EA